MDEPPRDPIARNAVEPESRTAMAPEGRAQVAPGRQGGPPVTALAKAVGVILLVSSLGALSLVAVGPLALLFSRTAEQVAQVVIFEIAAIALTGTLLLGGFEILRSRDRGRVIGIGASALLCAGFLVTELTSPDGLVFWLPVAAYGFSSVALAARWRAFPRAPSSRSPGRVTRLAVSAGIALAVLGFGQAAYGIALALSDESDVPVALRGASVVIGVLIVVAAILEALIGLAIVRGAEWGRRIGIVAGVILGAWTFSAAAGYTEVRINGIGDPGRPIYAPAFVVFAYAAIVLAVRWRAPATD